MSNRTKMTLLAIGIIAAMVPIIVAAARAVQDGPVPAEEEFNQRVTAYVELRDGATGGLPAIDGQSQPEEIVALRRAHAVAIREARGSAAEGDIFTPRVQEHFRVMIQAQFHSPTGTSPEEEAALGDGNPEGESDVSFPPVELRINAEYPVEAPLSTVPPRLLMRLPALPEELEYRFVGPHLILRDKKANIIVDFMDTGLSPD